MSAVQDHAASLLGAGTSTLILMHGYGCDQAMWDQMIPLLQGDYQLMVYNLAGSGSSNLDRYDLARHGTLQGHADDLIALMDDMGIEKATLVGHSVSAMIATLAANAHPARVKEVIMVCPSPGFVNDPPYVGGFERADIDGLLEALEENFVGWSSQMAPTIMGTPDVPQHGERLVNSFCQTDPDIARHFARVTFLADHREDVKALSHPTLALHCRDDAIVPDGVGDWMAAHMARLTHVRLDATGHCPHVSYPQATADAIRHFLNNR